MYWCSFFSNNFANTTEKLIIYDLAESMIATLWMIVKNFWKGFGREVAPGWQVVRLPYTARLQFCGL
jgi:hypothetical protein